MPLAARFMGNIVVVVCCPDRDCGILPFHNNKVPCSVGLQEGLKRIVLLYLIVRLVCWKLRFRH